MKVKSESEVTQLCLTLHDSMDCKLPGSSFHGIFQARVLEWGAIAFSKAISAYLKGCHQIIWWEGKESLLKYFSKYLGAVRISTYKKEKKT